jgi:predicted O-linked N-acetylglucosamine transferase (SPINDLY family)
MPKPAPHTAHRRAPAAAPDFASRRRLAYDAATRNVWADADRLLSALTTDPRFHADDWFTLGTARFHTRRYAEAAEAATRVYEHEPQNFKAAHLLTLALMAQNRHAQALAVFEQHASGPARQGYDFVLNHGAVLSQLDRPQDALSVYLEAAALNIGDPAVHMRLGIVLKDLKLFEESAESFLTALTLDPQRFAARLMVMHMRQFACQWQGFEAARAEILAALAVLDENRHDRAEGAIWSLTAIEHPPLLFKKAAMQVAGKQAVGVSPLPRRPLPAAGQRRLRIGYLSGDFHNHATALLMVEMLECRDRDRFETVLYSHSPNDGSPVEARIRAACERFVDVNTLSDRQAAERIQADGIDILVDLKGHTFRNRLGVLAHRPAPIQATWLGFPGTTGADYIDYFIGDRWVTPLAHAAHYTEHIAQLQGCYQPNDSQRERPEPSTRARCGLPEDALVLGCFNQSFKISPENFGAWMRILQAVPRAVLWLLFDNAQATENLRREAQAHGIDPARLLFAPRVPVRAHLARLPLADLMVDNWPCNAHTTASDALWMGVPLVTTAGEGFAGRVAGSLLHGVGLGELVCESVSQYEACIVDLLNDPARLQALRRHLDAGRSGFALFDGRRFAADIEQLYLRMAARARAGLPPAALPVQPAAAENTDARAQPIAAAAAQA